MTDAVRQIQAAQEAQELSTKAALDNAVKAYGQTVLDMIERARVVAVLDGWAAKHKLPTPAPRDFGNGCFEVWLCQSREPGHKHSQGYVGETPDAARAAAAKAIEAGEV